MSTLPQPFNYLKNHSKFTSVEEMDQHVKMHVQTHYNDLKVSAREVLFSIAKHALQFAGAAHLKAETIAKEIAMSTKSVYRSIKELVEFGIIAKENKPRKNGIKGANIYSILPFVQSNVPSETSHRENPEKSCESNKEDVKNEPESLSSFNPSLVSKDTNITEKRVENDSVNKELVKKKALLAKIPEAIRGLTMYFDTAQDIHDMVGVIFNAKKSVDKTVQIEDHPMLFNKTINSVYEYWQRQIKKGKVDYNVFGLMRKAICELVQKIVAGTAYEVPTQKQTTATPVSKELIQQFMIDNETDPIRKIELQMQRDALLTNLSKGKKDIFNYALVSEQSKDIAEIDFEAERQKVLAKLYG